MGDAPKKRPWYRLHWLTWVLLLVVGWSLVAENLAKQIWLPPFGQLLPAGIVLSSQGWPFYFGGGTYDSYDNSRLIAIDDFLHLTLNILIALSILASTAFTSESYFRRQSKWHQFSIQSVLAFTTFIALLLANAKYDLVRWRGDAPWEYIPFFFIAVGLWCVFWTAWRLVGWGVGWIGGGSKQYIENNQIEDDLSLQDQMTSKVVVSTNLMCQNPTKDDIKVDA